MICFTVISPKEFLALIVAIGIIFAICMAVYGRINQGKGIGWQFIRFTVIMLSLPLITILALVDSLNSTVATIFAGALGYAFAKNGADDKNDV